MKVAITGGSGKLGRFVVQEFVDHGWTVLNLDRSRPDDWRRSRFLQLDLSDLGQVYDAMASFRPDVVCHLAANPQPQGHPRHAQFMDNVASTHAIYQVSADLGVKRMIYASSEMVNGWSSTMECPPRLPFNEDDVTTPTNTYAVSKKVGEELADCIVAKHPEMPVVSLRINYVSTDHDYERWREFLPKGDHWSANLWGYIDAADAAVAFRLAAEAETTGHRVYMVAAADTFLDAPTRETILRHREGIAFDEALAEYGSCVDCRRIKEELGWEPKVSWRTLKEDGPLATPNI